MNGFGYNGYDQNGMPNNGEDLMLGQEEMNGMLNGGQSLHDIVNQNAKVIRRQSMPQGYGTSSNLDNPDMRRISMANFTGASSMGDFTFDPNAAMMSGDAQNSGQRRSRDLALNTSFGNTTPAYASMMPSNSAFASPAHPGSALDMQMNSPFVDPTMGMQMDYGIEQDMNNDQLGMNMYNQNQFNSNAMASPMQQQQLAQGTPNSIRGQDNLSGGQQSGMSTQYSRQSEQSNLNRHLSRAQSMTAQELSSPMQHNDHGGSAHTSLSNSHQHANSGFVGQPQHPVQGSAQDRGMHLPSNRYDGLNGPVPVNPANYNPNNQGFAWEQPEGGWPSTMVGKPHMQSAYKNAYSSTGFDMLGVLMRVATRPNPEINIGSVDLSCAFVVCDAEKDDFPIVYCSENFERLTGYTKHMILGRNCRFLQSPDGNVAPGVRRKYVDDDSVLYLKNMINLRREAQISLINYRRGGQPFMNLLTMIPVSWDSNQVKFFVGFQVDLVEQPNAVTNRNPDGSYSINYQRGMAMPRYVLNAPESTAKAELGQTVSRDDVSSILSTIGSGESELTKRVWDKVLLENTDDVVHVLSLKGLFQWVSPSALRVLEYEPGEIIGTALSSVCHPSDIVPVTRELKDTSTGASVNVVFRIRRKTSGYMWFEGHGSLHTEQGKGRKSIIMVGRERPVYALNKTEIAKAGGIGENELWTKMSTSGMFLYVSSNVRQLLDRQPDELVGVSIQTLMRADSKQEFGRILEHARAGKRASVKHEMINRRGQVLSAHTTLYPGDAVEGQKPTFIVAQTRLIKFARGTTTTRPGLSKQLSESAMTNTDDNTVGSVVSAAPYKTTEDSAITYAGLNGPTIGHQDQSLASDENLFDELKTTKSSSWQYEIRQLEKRNRMLAEEVQSLIAAKKKRKRRKGAGNQQKDCANCHTRVTPEWRRGPSGQRDLCNSCGLRWAKLNGRVSPRTSSQHSVHSAASDKASKASASPRNPSGLKNESPIMNAATPGEPRERGEPRESPKVKPTEGHAAQMEGASGVPPKIEEEPSEVR
ncbi:hypothetical protein AMS68_006494 [Peltaster fructicola]|uniref:White collar 1 protein n=1 Tax=Peltaster fructicola TaxID=286661 RepID=A0A6H0Y1W1_9PEZI|nr:hypothetical protein AMS68_006494 [Peltaster fructicola]